SDRWVMGSLDAGLYSVHLVVGSPTTTNGVYGGTVSGVTWSGSQTANNRWIDVNLAASVGSNGLLTIAADSTNPDNRLCFIDVLKAPTAPTYLRVSSVTTTPSVTLQWQDTSDNETEFIVDRATD